MKEEGEESLQICEMIEKGKEMVSVFLIQGQSVLIKTKMERDAANNYYGNVHDNQEFKISSDSNPKSKSTDSSLAMGTMLILEGGEGIWGGSETRGWGQGEGSRNK